MEKDSSILAKCKIQYKEYLKDKKKYPNSEYKFKTKHKYPCLIKRNCNETGNWLGYIITKIKIDSNKLYVHGGITYNEEFGDNYKIGFDTCHDVGSDDFDVNSYERYFKVIEKNKQLGEMFLPNGSNPTYKNYEFVKCELESLSKQLSNL